MRLIDADKLIDFIDCGHLRSPTEKCFSELDVVNLLKQCGEVDAVPVVHVRWEFSDYADFWECFECGKALPDYTLPEVWRYCPNCGARME